MTESSLWLVLLTFSVGLKARMPSPPQTTVASAPGASSGGSQKRVEKGGGHSQAGRGPEVRGYIEGPTRIPKSKSSGWNDDDSGTLIWPTCSVGPKKVRCGCVLSPWRRPGSSRGSALAGGCMGHVPGRRCFQRWTGSKRSVKRRALDESSFDSSRDDPVHRDFEPPS